jgi:predicted RNase H-like HicB family nuclease
MLVRSAGNPTPEWIGNCVLSLSTGDCDMHNEFTAIIERDGDWYIAYCPEISGANGQGRTLEECRQSLAEAIALILEDRRQDVLRGVPDEAIREVVVVE